MNGVPPAVSIDDDWTEPADDLTPPQRAAVEHFEGPLLVLAGPGSGKTRVITRRISHLIDKHHVRRWEILAITFTNKAAREMAERVQKLPPFKHVWVSTFHRFCARLLREHGRAVGLQPNFSIYDTSDQQQLIKQVLHDLDFDATHFPPAKLGQRISQAKNELLTPEQYVSKYGEGIGTHLEAVVAKVYPAYQKRLLEANAVDFDDMLMHVALILEENEVLRTDLDQRFRFILVDEYQDTNQAQYRIVKALSQLEPNLCAVGDPDQSIYGWRGARIEYMLRFEQDFPDTKLIRLEDNFRSTPEILQTADTLIAHNAQRKAKRLHTNKPSGEAVELRLFNDGYEEADAITNEIRALVESGERQWKDFAIFYRVNSLSRSLETALARQKVPHQVAGGVAFFERMEVKDLLGYLRLIENSQDRVAFLRVVNTPARGIGKSSLDKLVRWADRAGLSLLDAARHPERVPDLPKKAVVQLRTFANLIDELAAFTVDSEQPRDSAGDEGGELVEESLTPEAGSEADVGDAVDGPVGLVEGLLRAVMQRTGYARQFADARDENDMQRLSNIDELVSAARQYDQQDSEDGQEHSLGGFLETASLAQDVDSLDVATGAVTLMTLHSAKGLEFPVVYIVAVEQNIIPHERSLRENDPRQLEEERRLLFVGITRAEEKLVLTHTLRRMMHGRSLSTIPSDFLGELNVASRDQTAVDDFHFGDEWQDSPHDETPDESPDEAHDEGHDFHDDFAADEFAEETPRGATRATSRDGTNRNTSARGTGPGPVRKQPAERTDAQRTHSPNGPNASLKGLKLTTAAALQAGTNEPPELRSGFLVGMQVRHPRYGLGTVVDVSGMARRRTVTVDFVADNRRECFVEAKCPLQPVGLR